MNHIWIVLGVPVAFALGGCNATTSAYVKAAEGFTEAMDAAKTSVKLLAEQRTRVARVAYAHNVIVRHQFGGRPAEEEFGDFVCKGTGAISDARAGMALLGQYGKSVHDLLNKADQDVASLWESIATIEERQAKLKKTKPATEQADCVDEVAGLLAIEMPGTPESGLVAGILTIKSVVDGLNEALKAGMSMRDEAARAKALQTYIRANTKTVAALIDKLDQTSVGYDQLCRGKAGKGRVFCKIYTEKPDGAGADYMLPEPNELAAQFLWQKWASLRQPYLRFQTFGMVAATARTPEEKLRAMDIALGIHRRLGEYDALRATPSPQLLPVGLREAQQALVDVAEGKTPPGAGWVRIVAWASAWGDVASGLSDAKKAIDGED